MKKFILTFAILLFISGVSIAKGGSDKKDASHEVNIEINTHALIGIAANSGSTAISLTPKAPKAAGLGLDFTNATNSNLWLNYSSIVTDGKTNTISASLSGDELPNGITIGLEITADKGAGQGIAGKGQKIVLEKGGNDVVTGIKNCFTGNGSEKGHNLKYTLNMTESKYQDISVKSFNTTITYTITEN